MVANRMFTGLAALSLALGIGANTAIYSFMDSILLRSLPVADPASLIVVKWQSRPVNFGRGDAFVMRSMRRPHRSGFLGKDDRGHLSRIRRSSVSATRRRRSCPASSHTGPLAA